jgi:hypothetical protein
MRALTVMKRAAGQFGCHCEERLGDVRAEVNVPKLRRVDGDHGEDLRVIALRRRTKLHTSTLHTLKRKRVQEGEGGSIREVRKVAPLAW